VHLDVESAARKARRHDFKIATTFVPAGTLVPPKAHLAWFKTASSGPHLWPELSAIGGQEETPNSFQPGVQGAHLPLRAACGCVADAGRSKQARGAAARRLFSLYSGGCRSSPNRPWW